MLSTSTVVTLGIAGHFLINSVQETHIVEAEGPEDLAAEVQEAREDLAVEAQEDLTREETAWNSMTSTAKEKETTLTGPSTS